MSTALGGCMTVGSSPVTRVSSYGPAITYNLRTAGDVNQTIRPQRPVYTAYALGLCRLPSGKTAAEKVECN